MYIDTFLCSTMLRTSIPFSIKARSKPKLQPKKKLTKSGLHTSVISVT